MDSARTIVWQRQYDEEVHRRSMQRFRNYYVVPVAVLIAVVAVFSGIGPASGLLIVFGLFGLMLFVWIWLHGRNERTNPTVVLEGGELRWAQETVPIDQVEAFSTYTGESSMTVAMTTTPGGVNARATIGVARFLLADGDTVEFRWAELDKEQLAELRSALEGLLPGRWRPAGELRR